MKRRAFVTGMVTLPSQLGQMAQQARIPQQQRIVVPLEVIKRYELRQFEGFGIGVLGQDGFRYQLDDVLFALFDMVKEHWNAPVMKK